MCYSDNWGNPDLFALICGRPRYRDVALFPFGGFEHQEVVWRKYNGFHPRGWAIFLERLGNASRNWFSIQLQYISNHMYVSFRNVVNLLVWPPRQLSDGSWHWKLPRELSTNTPLDDEIDYFYFHCAKCTLVHICRNAHCFRPSAGVYIYIYIYIYIVKGELLRKHLFVLWKVLLFSNSFTRKKTAIYFTWKKSWRKKKVPQKNDDLWWQWWGSIGQSSCFHKTIHDPMLVYTIKSQRFHGEICYLAKKKKKRRRISYMSDIMRTSSCFSIQICLKW